MLVIFPIANADGKILSGSDADSIEQLARIVPNPNERFNTSNESDTIKQNDTVALISDEDIKEVEAAVEKAAMISTGVVSWYGGKFQGRKTASGDVYDKHELTAAHKTLPFGTKVKVTNTRNGKSVVVEINDRGPFVKSRVLDLSQAAFNEIGHTNTGVMHVEYEVIENN